MSIAGGRKESGFTDLIRASFVRNPMPFEEEWERDGSVKWSEFIGKTCPTELKLYQLT